MTPWDYVADISAAVGGFAGLIGIVIGTRALRDSHGGRLDAARDRNRRRLELIDDQLVKIYEAAQRDEKRMPEGSEWRSFVPLLVRYLAATGIELPKCNEVTQQTTAFGAALVITAARTEVVAQLMALAIQDLAAAERKPSLWQQYLQGIKGTPTTLTSSPPKALEKTR